MNLIPGDCIEVMATLEENSVDAIVTDPPYGLGFMGKQWDEMPPGDETAAAMFRALKPAHYLVAFGGTRTHHRLMVALEDAGFEIRDVLMWLHAQGFPKGKGNLKPAYEPIILCRKPGQGVRALGIEECRIEYQGDKPTQEEWNRVGSSGAPGANGHAGQFSAGLKSAYARGLMPVPSGRWPANVILDGSAAAMLDAEVGTGASRFFYCAKASTAERNAGCEGLEAKPRYANDGRGCSHEVFTPGAGDDDWARKNPCHPRANYHPTVKPVALMRWLVRLIAPEGGTVLDPFTGSGTTGVACAMEGRDFIGIEREAEYLAIADARIRHASRQGVLAV